MKKTFSLLIVSFLCLFTSCNNKLNNKDIIITPNSNNIKNISSSNKERSLDKLTTIKFEKKVIDLGNFFEGDSILVANYIFKNTGKNPLLIEYVNPECTCTGYTFTKDTIFENKEGFINLTYNIKKRIGKQKLYAIVKTNTNAKFHKLILKLNVLEKENLN